MPIGGGGDSSQEVHYGIQRYPVDGLVLRSRAKWSAVRHLLRCLIQSGRRRSEEAIKCSCLSCDELAGGVGWSHCLGSRGSSCVKLNINLIVNRSLFAPKNFLFVDGLFVAHRAFPFGFCRGPFSCEWFYPSPPRDIRFPAWSEVIR